MFKKIQKIILICLSGSILIAGTTALAAKQLSPSSAEEIYQQIKDLRAELLQIKQLAEEAREIAIDSRTESAKFQEEVLYRLGLWRTKLGKGMMMVLSAEDVANRAIQMAKTAQEATKLVEERADIAYKAAGEAQNKAKLALEATNKLGEKVDLLAKKVDSLASEIEDLKIDVSAAKEMAATAKIQADQTKKETRELAEEVRRNRELFLRKIEELLKKAKVEEEKLKPKEAKLKPPARKYKIYTVKRGDTLESIAADPNIYNDPTKWKKIFEANKDRILNPNLIYPGQKLIIPEE